MGTHSLHDFQFFARCYLVSYFFKIEDLAYELRARATVYQIQITTSKYFLTKVKYFCLDTYVRLLYLSEIFCDSLKLTVWFS